MKKGFTLIELLAVIVILAIIAVIATPIVLNIIKDAKKSSNIRSAENYLKSVELEIVKSRMTGNPIADGTYSIDELDVEVSGAKPTSGYVKISNGKVAQYNMIINNKNEEMTIDYNKWDGAIEAITSEDSVTYHITKPSQLAWVAQQVNSGTNNFSGKTIYLETNLDLDNREWTPIGNITNPFQGTFEGNNHTIKRMFINLTSIDNIGLFGYTKDSSKTQIIRNLIVTNSNITGHYQAGIIVGYSNNIDISNCISYNNIAKGDYNVGGIVGRTRDDGNISDCKSIDNEIIGNFAQIGGISGWLGDATIENSYSNSYVTGEYGIGGILGITSPTVIPAKIENVVSKATVVGISNNCENRCDSIGGIIGGLYGGHAFNNSKSYASVKGYIAGGAVGRIMLDSSENNSINNIQSYSQISSYDSNSANSIGGLFGYIDGKSTDVNISNVNDYSNITTSSTSKIGGLAGYSKLANIRNVKLSTIINGNKITDNNIIGLKEGTNTLTNIAIE